MGFDQSERAQGPIYILNPDPLKTLSRVWYINITFNIAF